jgi:hypothetical protein
MKSGEKRNTATMESADPHKGTRSHYVMTFENPYVDGGTGRVQLLLTALEVRKHAQVLANVFGTVVHTERKSFEFDTAPESWTNPYYAAVCGEIMETINGIKPARFRAQELANEMDKTAYVEHMRGGKWVGIETFYPQTEEEFDIAEGEFA